PNVTTGTGDLFLVADIIDANLGSGTIYDRCVACYVGCSQNRYFAEVRFACFDGLERRSCQNSTNRSATPVGLWHARRDANVFVSALRKQSGRHSFTVSLSNCVNNVESVVDLGCAEVQCRSILAADCFLPVELWLSQFRSHGLQGRHRFCNSRVRLSLRHIRHVSVMLVMMARVSACGGGCNCECCDCYLKRQSPFHPPCLGLTP